jgi:hypothetical protein
MSKSKHLITAQLITFVAYGITYKVQKAHPNFNEIKELLESGKTRAAVTAYNKGLKKEAVSGFLVKDNSFYYKGQILPEVFAEMYKEGMGNNGKFSSVKQFFDNIISNPKQMCVDDLARFMKNQKMPITSRGTFLAYKRVRSNFRDTHSGTMDNTPGQIVSMDRELTDSNSNQECSSGLHVCAHSYLSEFVDSQTIVVEVNPKNVVAVPHGYSGAKMRVCEFKSLMTLKRFKEVLMIRAQDALSGLPYFDFEANNLANL